MGNRNNRGELELIAAAAHELKTPLTIVRGVSDMLASDAFGALNDRQQEQIEHIRRAGNRINALVESLLHVENLPYTQDIRPVQLHSQLQAVIDELGATAQQRDVSIRWQTRRTLPPVLIEARSTYQLLSHALAAVIKQVPAASEIVVRTRRRGEMVVVRIDAPGEPITPKELSRIEHTVGKQMQPVGADGSTGLSWYIVKSIISFYQGKLGVSPRTNYTAISLRIPISNQLSLF
jgi:two-component system phosphate regulon sensor histidine kinase PhoR